MRLVEIWHWICSRCRGIKNFSHPVAWMYTSSQDFKTVKASTERQLGPQSWAYKTDRKVLSQILEPSVCSQYYANTIVLHVRVFLQNTDFKLTECPIAILHSPRYRAALANLQW